ncbi:MAG: exodeoxyribonuclease V subunit gamma, partial [Elusimicrobiaceae bacterium]|nr:exodeoxyribonuclease V subunit gamma [Elusimicrobiaceae bacterium]
LAEDPIFRDRYRYILRDVLGYWVSQKAERTQEERLLFFTACSAALQRLYVSYACRGEDGKEQVPSVYVAELARATQKVWSAQEKPRVSARTAARLGTVPAEFWTPKEMSYMIMLQGAGPAAAGYCQAGLADDDTNRRLDAVAALKQHGPVGGFDGCIQSGPAVFAQAQQKGFSPSALQELAGCPLKYFFHRVLHLEDKEEVYSRQDLSPDKRGTAYHKILEDFYREMNRAQMTHQLFDSGVEMYLDRALTKHYTPQSYRQFGIYPVVWELLLEQIRTQLVAFVQEDVKALGSFTPSYFEREFPALELDGLPVRLRGIIDRIDLDTSGKTFFIVDYKSSRKWGKSVAESFFTQLIFQPFLYLLAAGKLPELAGFSPAGACLLAIRKGYERGELSMEQALEMSPRVQQFFTLLADLMQQGSFVCTPSSSCTYCPYGAICRKDSFSCLLRARKSGVAKQLEEARQHV